MLFNFRKSSADQKLYLKTIKKLCAEISCNYGESVCLVETIMEKVEKKSWSSYQKKTNAV